LTFFWLVLSKPLQKAGKGKSWFAIKGIAVGVLTNDVIFKPSIHPQPGSGFAPNFV